MTPLGAVMRLDDHTEAIYLYGAKGGRAPGWYLRHWVDGAAGRIRELDGGPYESCAAAEAANVARKTPAAPSFESLHAQVAHVLSTYQGMASQPASPDKSYDWASPASRASDARVLTPRRYQGVQDRHVLMSTPSSVLVITPGALIWAANPASACRIDDYVKLEAGEGMVIGARVHVTSFCHLGIGGGVTLLEDDSSYGSGAKVLSGSSVQTREVGCSPLSPGVTIRRGFAWVKRHATLYAGAIMLPNCVLGEGSVLAAGAVLKAGTVTGDHELWAGVPARLIKEIR